MNEKDKLKELILAILDECGEIPKVKLAKLVLFSEIEHFRKTGHSFTGLYFVRLNRGPVIAHFDEVLEQYIGDSWERKITEIPIYEEGRFKRQYLYRSIKKENLPTDVKKTVKEICEKYGQMTGTKLSQLTHGLPAYKYSEPNEPIFVSELSVETDDEYFELLDIIEEIEEANQDEEDRALGQEISRIIPSAKVPV